MMRDDVRINWQSPLGVTPVLNRHYLVADGESQCPAVISGAKLMTGLENVLCIAELPDAPTVMEAVDG